MIIEEIGIRDTGGAVALASSTGVVWAIEGSKGSEPAAADGTPGISTAGSLVIAELDSPAAARASALPAISAFVGRPRFFFGG